MDRNDGHVFRCAVHVILFNCDRTILKMLQNCGPFVEKIYVAYSPVAWTYNPDARRKNPNKTSLSILMESDFYSKVEIIHGAWETDEDTRNACLKKAKADGFDFLIIQDPDEFYSHADYSRNIDEIVKHPHYEQYYTSWITFWKTHEFVLIDKYGSCITGHPPFAVNLKKDVFFVRSRTTSGISARLLPGVCYHLSYILSDDEILLKISTWAHTREFNTDEWYSKKWLGWNPFVMDLHPLDPESWKITSPFRGPLPEEIKDFASPAPTVTSPSPAQIAGAVVQVSYMYIRGTILAVRVLVGRTSILRTTVARIRIFFTNLAGHIRSDTLRHAAYRQLAGISVPRDSSICHGARFFDPWNVRVGSHSIIGGNALLDGRNGLYIGNNVSIGGEVRIYTGDADPGDPHSRGREAPVVIQDGVYIGPNVTILPGVTIHQGAAIEPGAVVTGDVRPGTRVGGVPATSIQEG